jgi:hypothetical protein
VKTTNVREAVETVLLAAADNPTPAISEQEFLRLLVGAFGNDGVIPMPKVPLWVPDSRRDVAHLPVVYEGFRKDLRALVEGRLTVADRKRIYVAGDRMVLVPRTAEDGAVKYQYVAAGLDVVIGYAMRLLMDPRYRNDLKQCRWKDCNGASREPDKARRFFFVSQRREAAAAAGKEVTGKLPDRYCCEEHMRAAHRTRATEATLRRRKEQRAATARTLAKRK